MSGKLPSASEEVYFEIQRSSKSRRNGTDECFTFIVTSSATDKKLEIDKELENKLEINKNLEIKLEIDKNLEIKLEIYKNLEINSKFIAILNSKINSKFSSFLSMVDEVNIRKVCDTKCFTSTEQVVLANT